MAKAGKKWRGQRNWEVSRGEGLPARKHEAILNILIWRWDLNSSAAVAAAAKSLQLCPTLCDPIDGSPPGSAIPGILQARTLEWVAISFSNAWKWNVKVKSLSHVRLLVTPWTPAYQAPLSMGFSRQEYWSGVPLLSSLKAPKAARQMANSSAHPPPQELLLVWDLRLSQLCVFLPIHLPLSLPSLSALTTPCACKTLHTSVFQSISIQFFLFKVNFLY